MKRYLLLLLVPCVVFGFGTGTIKKIDQIESNTGTDIILKPANDVKIDNFTGNFVLQSGSSKEVEESATSNTELSYLSGATSSIQTQLNTKVPDIRSLTMTAPLLIDGVANRNLTVDRTISMPVATTSSDGYLSSTDWNTFNGKANDADVVKLTTAQSIAGVKTFTTQFIATSTTDGSHPAPTMTEAQRDAVTGMVAGDQIYNSDTDTINYYDGTAWNEVGTGSGAGGSRLNLVEFPSFEDDITEGTCTLCSLTAETTNVLATINNATSLKIEATSNNATYIVDKSTSSQWHTGMGILKSVWIKTSAVGAKFISRVDGSDESVELEISSGDTWKLYKIPTKSGTTSNGYKISIVTSGEIVYIDETSIKPNDELLQVGQAHFVGKLDLSNNCTYTRSNSLYGKLISTSCSATAIEGDITLINDTEAGVKMPNFRTDGYYEVVIVGLLQNAGNSNVCTFSLSKSFSGTDGNGQVYMNTNSSGSREQNGISASTRFSSSDSGIVYLIAKNGASADCTFYATSGNPSTITVKFFPDSSNTIVTQTTELNKELSNQITIRTDGSTTVISTDFGLTSDYTSSRTGGTQSCINYTSLGLTVVPKVSAFIHHNSGVLPTGIASYSSTTTVTDACVYTYDDSGVAYIPSEASWTINKQGADVNKSATIVGKFENIDSSDLNFVYHSQGQTNEVITALTENIKFDTLKDDENNLWDSGAREFVAPRDMIIHIEGMTQSTAAVASQSVFGYVDTGGGYNVYDRMGKLGNAAETVLKFSGLQKLNKGDKFAVRWGQTATTSGITRDHYIKIFEQATTESIIKNMNDNKKIECETKVLSANVSSTTGYLADLQFNNLVIGKMYDARLQSRLTNTGVSGDDSILDFIHDGQTVMRIEESTGTTVGTRQSAGTSKIFKATATIAQVYLAQTGSLVYAGDTWLELCELNDNYIETTKFD